MALSTLSHHLSSCPVVPAYGPRHRRRSAAPLAQPPPTYSRLPGILLVSATADVSAATGQAQARQRSVELASDDMKAAVTLARLRAGPGYAIVIATVAPGSEAASLGLRPGQQLLQVSDPIRPNEMWRLDENSSLRHVRQAVRMRVPETTTLLLSDQPIPEWASHLAAARAAAVAERDQAVDLQRLQEQKQQQQQQEQANTSTSSKEPEPADDLLSAIVAASSGESFDSGDEAASRGLTVAEKLEAQYWQQQEGGGSAAQGLTALEKRQQRRKEYFQQASERNDGPFFAMVGALFVLPPAIILLAAAASGYLDSLDMYGAMR